MYRPWVTRSHGGPRRRLGNYLVHSKNRSLGPVHASLLDKLINFLFKEEPQQTPESKALTAQQYKDEENARWNKIYDDLEK